MHFAHDCLAEYGFHHVAISLGGYEFRHGTHSLVECMTHGDITLPYLIDRYNWDVKRRDTLELLRWPNGVCCTLYGIWTQSNWWLRCVVQFMVAPVEQVLGLVCCPQGVRQKSPASNFIVLAFRSAFRYPSLQEVGI